jgi:hypothetical protein
VQFRSALKILGAIRFLLSLSKHEATRTQQVSKSFLISKIFASAKNRSQNSSEYPIPKNMERRSWTVGPTSELANAAGRLVILFSPGMYNPAEFEAQQIAATAAVLQGQ